MAPRAPEGARAAIAAVVAALPPSMPLSGDDLAAITEIVCERPMSRQWLWLSAEVRAAVKAHEQASATAAEPARETTVLGRAQATIRRLRAEIAERDACLNRYHELLMLHLRNAREHDVTQEQLERPLRKPSR